MKYVILNIIVCIMMVGCDTNKYYGYVYDFKTEKPLLNVDIKDSITGIKTKSNNMGYFNIEINSKSGIILLFQKKGYKTKIIEETEHPLGEFTKTNFKGEKIYLQLIEE